MDCIVIKRPATAYLSQPRSFPPCGEGDVLLLFLRLTQAAPSLESFDSEYVSETNYGARQKLQRPEEKAASKLVGG
jgi:hypothetical protein